MIKNISFILVFLLSIVSCDSESNIPDNLIDEEEMILVIKDLMLLEATYNTQLTSLEDKNERMIMYSDEIFAKHNVSKKDFDVSYAYYIENPEEFEAMLELVFEELNKMETETAKYKEDEKAKRDSTKASR